MSLQLLGMASEPPDVTVSGLSMTRGRKLYEKTCPSDVPHRRNSHPCGCGGRDLDSPGEAEIRGVEATKVQAARCRPVAQRVLRAALHWLSRHNPAVHYSTAPPTPD